MNIYKLNKKFEDLDGPPLSMRNSIEPNSALTRGDGLPFSDKSRVASVPSLAQTDNKSSVFKEIMNDEELLKRESSDENDADK